MYWMLSHSIDFIVLFIHLYLYHALLLHINTETENIMSSLNRVTLIGHLGADPETRAFNDGTIVCNLRMATSESWKDRTTGEQRESTEWHRVVLYRRLAEIAEQYLRKGAQIYIEGKLRTKKWTDKTGAERYTTEIEGDELKMLGKANQSSTPPVTDAWDRSSGTQSRGSSGQAGDPAKVTTKTAIDPFEDDGIPF
jgi:single-strand DNA-binding protein